MGHTIFNSIYTAKAHKKKQLAVLIDPDKPDPQNLSNLAKHANEGNADYIFLGGSLLIRDALDSCIEALKSQTDIPVVIFPGSVLQISGKADALLFLSLISGRNPDLLIGNQVIAAPYIKQLNLEALPTGYMLIDSGKPTTASYMSGTAAIPHDKADIAACTAMAGEMLGLKFIYMDGGSGAQNTISTTMVEKVRQAVDLPIIIGGGIRDAETAVNICEAGADIVVIGNATEHHPEIIKEIAEAIHNV